MIDEPAQTQALVFLDVTDDQGQKLRVPLETGHILIGRSSKASLQLNDDQISRQHAEIYCDPLDQWWVRDLGSSNGVLINGDRVYRDIELESGDQLTMGPFEMLFRNRVDEEGDDEASFPKPPIKKTQAVPIHTGDPASAPSTPSGPPDAGFFSNDLAETTQIVPIGAPPPNRSTESNVPRISTIHISTLAEFTKRLAGEAKLSERMRLLCRLMVRSDFQGKWAVVMRLSKKDDRKTQPKKLCDPQCSRDVTDQNPPMAQQVFKAIRRSSAPVQAPIPGGVAGEPLTAIACPLLNRPHALEILYAVFPASCGGAEWMALVSLAAQQFMQTETAMIARREAEAHAAVERELDAARQIQDSLIPSDPGTDAMEVSIGFQACKRVGGDYADSITRPNGNQLLIMADVCGKGLGSALITASLHTAIRTTALAGLSLEAIINHLNTHLCRTLDPGSFVSMIAVEIDPTTGEAAHLNAGHRPGLLVSPDGRADTLSHSANMPLGLADQAMAAEPLTIGQGQVLGLFTDGVTEMLDANENMLGTDGFGRMMAKAVGLLSAKPLDAVRRQIKIELDRALGDRVPTDDRTYLLARRKG